MPIPESTTGHDARHKNVCEMGAKNGVLGAEQVDEGWGRGVEGVHLGSQCMIPIIQVY